MTVTRGATRVHRIRRIGELHTFIFFEIFRLALANERLILKDCDVTHHV